MRFLLGILFGFFLLAAGVSAILFTGMFNTAATVPTSGIEKTIGALALDKSVAKRATDKKTPLPDLPEVKREGLVHYRENCLVCHGAPGVEAGEIGSGLNPAPPDLTLPRIQARSDGDLFWLTSQGIRMTGMPAFAPTHSEEEIWTIVAFLRHLPALTAQEQALLKAGREASEGHHDEAPQEGGSAPAKPGHSHKPGTPPHKD